MTTTARHEIRALLRAHLSAAAGYRHSTRYCPVCRRLLRLAMEPAAKGSQDAGSAGVGEGAGALDGPAAGESARCR
ncbi:DUF6274 family protein [Streptomyces palmae]|uniref:Uncharacterized protein n=1 Tax=Streptomyces palmae TaxID=1701085 RepID=A0A4Z0HBV3_9ACTN|nr:DUF6274 family protein [Streptomyces palmae]TGB13810.1 hypothetical protein E4099_09500 [Streptomyces palmae]